MKSEKSCGAVIFHKKNHNIKILLLKHVFGDHWSFPKGHVEGDESELQTAIREIKEETGLDHISFYDGFRYSVNYIPRPDINKEVIYFLAQSKSMVVIPQESEIAEIKWVDIHSAENVVTYQNDRQLIRSVKNYIDSFIL